MKDWKLVEIKTNDKVSGKGQQTPPVLTLRPPNVKLNSDGNKSLYPYKEGQGGQINHLSSNKGKRT